METPLVKILDLYFFSSTSHAFTKEEQFNTENCDIKLAGLL